MVEEFKTFVKAQVSDRSDEAWDKDLEFIRR